MQNNKNREKWATKIGIILAMAGNAIGLGNFLRFPVQAAQNGGGAFMIPYFISLVILAIPVMWAEWALGRYGGSKGHGNAVGIFHCITKNPSTRYIGILGLIFPLLVAFYYIYIESWTLAYSFFSIQREYFNLSSQTLMTDFLKNFQGLNSPIGVTVSAYLFFLITFSLNFLVVSGGISKGIERIALIGMPILFLFALILTIRVFTLGTPDPSIPENNVINGLGFIWNPDFSKLTDAKIWLQAAGQIFFTTSIGFGSIMCYASYLKKDDDIAATGLSTVMTNEFAEVIFGGSIAIPVAYAFYGYTGTVDIAKSGAFNLGFVSLPIIFTKLPLGEFLGFIWFFLLFIAGITSSIALIQPFISFLKDELGWSHKKAVIHTLIITFIGCNIAIFGLRYGIVDDFDFWAGTFGITLFALIEIIIFTWIFGEKNAYEEINNGAKFNVPYIFIFLLKYISPLYIAILMISWIYQDFSKIIEANIYQWVCRLSIIILFLYVALLVKKSLKNKGAQI